MTAGARSTSPGLSRVEAGLALFQLGLALAIAHVTVALEIGVTLSRHGSLVKSLVLLLYPVAVALLGFGAALDRIVLRSSNPVPPLRASGALLVLFLVVTLRVNFLSSAPINQAQAAVAHVTVLGAWFLCAGVGLARLVRTARQGGARSTGRLWGVHQLGLVAGYLLQEALVPVVGANALHLVLAVSLMLPARWSLPVLVVGCLGAPTLDLDRHLEDLRDTSAVFDHDYVEVRGSSVLERIKQAGDEALRFRYRAWSRLGQFQLLQQDASDDDTRLAGWYNFQPQWSLQDHGGGELRRFRGELYDQLPVDGRVAILGVGGGRGLKAIPHPSKSYIAIERDPAVVHYFTEVRPDDNDRIFELLTTVAADGRHFLERQTEPFDAIVFESARYQPAHSLLPASAPYHLYTREAIAAAADHLTPDGWLSMGFTDVFRKPSMEYLPLQVSQSMRELGLFVRAFASDKTGHVHVIGCRSQACLTRMLSSPAGRHKMWQARTEDSPEHDYRLTDATPFGAWGTMSPSNKQRLLSVVAALAVLCAGLTGLLGWRVHRPRRWNPVPYFFSIGVAQSVLAVATCYLWRSYWQDDVLTVVRVLVYMIAFGAIGSALSSRVHVGGLPPIGRASLAAGLIALHFLATALVPFNESSVLLRELAALVLLAPGGLLMGLFFPLGLSSASTRHVGVVLLADALGALAGYTVLYLVALPFGVHAFAATSVATYAVAAAVWRPRPAAVGATPVVQPPSHTGTMSVRA